MSVEECIEKWGVKKRDVFLTPPEIHAFIKEEWGVDTAKMYDPCPFPAADVDGLKSDWKSPAFVNPPFSKFAKWARKAAAERDAGKTVYLLAPWQSSPKCLTSTTRSLIASLNPTRHIRPPCRICTFQSPDEKEPPAQIGCFLWEFKPKKSPVE